MIVTNVWKISDSTGIRKNAFPFLFSYSNKIDKTIYNQTALLIKYNYVLTGPKDAVSYSFDL